MCALFNQCNYSFKWIKYLIVTLSAYTFLHWFLATPLAYSILYDCCNVKDTKKWLHWFLLISFLFWIGISIVILLFWCCLRAFCKCRINESNADLNNEENIETNANLEGVAEKNNELKDLNKYKKKRNSNPSEILTLPELDSKGSLTILQMNDFHTEEEPISDSEFPIPVDKSCHFVQNETLVHEEKSEEKPLKTPREIFFKDMIEFADDSSPYFDFDLTKVSENILKKYNDAEDSTIATVPKSNLEDLKEKTENNTYFVGGSLHKENLTSEIFISLNEEKVNVD